MRGLSTLPPSTGLEGLTIGQLASELGMSKSGVFAHFGSKQELQLATVGRGGERFREAVIEPALQAPDGVPGLQAMGGAYLAHLESNGYSGGCFWAATSAEYDDRPGPVRERSPPRSMPGSASWSGRLASPASPIPPASPSSSTRW